MRLHLTDRFCDRAKPQGGEAQSDYFDETVSGLALRVTKLGTKAWTLHYSAASGRKRLTLGRYPALSLAAARSAALEVKANGVESLGSAGTLGAVWAEFYTADGQGRLTSRARYPHPRPSTAASLEHFARAADLRFSFFSTTWHWVNLAAHPR